MKILTYTTDALAEELHNEHTPIDVIKSKNHFRYLTEYLGKEGLNIKTIVVEEDYISKDFLKDYAAYYVSCFTHYDKCTKRLHFFSSGFSQKEFILNMLDKKSESESFWKSYCGFIVVKPIPVTVIGTTVLKTYSGKQPNGNRLFWGTRTYKIHLFGKQLELESLAFQEQDSVLSACATSSIWTVLQKAAEDYSIVLKTPGEITKDAGLVADGERLFPNKQGLQIRQMCQALQTSGLEVELRVNSIDRNYVDSKYLKKNLNAYSSLGLPVILIIEVPSGYKDKNATTDLNAMSNIAYGLHAISITGYKEVNLKSLNKKKEDKGYYNLLEKIYAHDDQWGHFARAEFENNNLLNTTWSKFHESEKFPSTKIVGLIVPVFPKVRISYDDIEPILLALMEIYKLSFEGELESGFVWDTKIMLSETYKQHVRLCEDLENPVKMGFLTRSLPKYVWVITCYCKEIRISDFIFDATGISNAMLGIEIVSYYSKIQEHFHKTLQQNPSFENYFSHRLKKRYFNFLLLKTCV